MAWLGCKAWWLEGTGDKGGGLEGGYWLGKEEGKVHRDKEERWAVAGDERVGGRLACLKVKLFS